MLLTAIYIILYIIDISPDVMVFDCEILTSQVNYCGPC